MPVENEEFAAEALRIHEAAAGKGLRLRILGSIAYRIHCTRHIHYFEQMARALTDIDFAAERSQTAHIERLFSEMGYIEDKGVAITSDGSRLVFTSPDGALNVDVFVDELFFCHRIPFAGRLHLDAPTIPLADLVLEKMQIVEINLKDLKDTLVLLLEHELSKGPETDKVDTNHICSLLGNDWGFFYTVNQNLAKVADYADRFEPLAGTDREIVKGRISDLVATIAETPKSLGWRLRARVGTRVKWYQEISAKDETFAGA